MPLDVATLKSSIESALNTFWTGLDTATFKTAIKAAMDAAFAVTDPLLGDATRTTWANSFATAAKTFVQNVSGVSTLAQSAADAIDTFVAPLGGGGASPSDAPPADVGTTGAGVSADYSRADHVHGHGNQAGGALHDVATGASAGFQSAADKTKLDGISASAAALTSNAPASVGTANAVGTGTAAAKDDHVHDHGSQTTGTHHAVATASVAGFQSAGDKSAWDSWFGVVSAGAQTLTDASGNNDVTGAKWAFTTIAEAIFEVVIEWDDRARVAHRSCRICLTDNPESIGTLANNLDTATGSDPGCTLSLYNDGSGNAQLRANVSGIGHDRNISWVARTKAALS